MMQYGANKVIDTITLCGAKKEIPRIYHNLIWSRDNIVGITTRCGLGSPGI